MLLKWHEAKLLANPERRSWIFRRCCGSSVTKAPVMGMWCSSNWCYPGARPVGYSMA